MFTELPKLFDRDFAIGYFLPVVIFITTNIMMFPSLGQGIDLKNLALSDTLLGTTIIGLISWTIGIFLLAANREVIRVLEGYGSLNPVKLFQFVEIHKFRKLKKRVKKIEEQIIEYGKTGTEVPTKLENEYREKSVSLAEEFPSQENWLLPTPFGNVVRAFETYPGEMYGIEAVEGWSRLLPLIPDNHQAQIYSSKSIVDFWINLGVLSLIFFVEANILRTIYPSSKSFIIFAIVSIFITWISAYRATSSAIDWGENIKSSFDLYLVDLAKKLGFEISIDRENEKNLWITFSQSTILRRPDLLPKRKPDVTYQKKD